MQTHLQTAVYICMLTNEIRHKFEKGKILYIAERDEILLKQERGPYSMERLRAKRGIFFFVPMLIRLLPAGGTKKKKDREKKSSSTMLLIGEIKERG